MSSDALPVPRCQGYVHGEPDMDDADVDFPRFEYSNKDVKRAGELIASNMAWTVEADAKIREAFKIANSWRDAHALPMRSLRCSILSHMGHLGIKGISAARLKRMPAIRRKLIRIGLSLNQLQDLGGCRAILDTMTDVRNLVQTLKEKIRHELRKEDNYIEEPKDDGYRSHHLILGFKGKNEEQSVFDGRRIELQIRTRMQHSWATAVEAVGLFRGEELKNHSGSQEWLRLFELMSGEIAEAEECPVHPLWSDRDQRRGEIRDLARALDAIKFLEDVRQGVRGTDFPLSPGYLPTHYLIRFDHATKTVSVQPFTKAILATKSYDDAEDIIHHLKKESENIVLVEVGKLENLKEAYPNYFGDVALFERELRQVVHGQPEYTRLPVRKAAWKPEPIGDPRWIGRNPYPRPGARSKKNRKKGVRAE
jgi:hypothetical protein